MSLKLELLIIFSLLFAAVWSASADFNSEVDISWGGGRAKKSLDGSSLQLSLDRDSGSGFQSRSQYLFGRFDIDIKLVPGNSAGTVSTYYLSSLGSAHDEIDMEFLGNSTGEPYVLHTNVFSRGKGNREQQFYLWFDPRADFHTYSIVWNPQQILFYVDGAPIRVFHNSESRGVPYLKSQPMRLYASLWDAEDWATQGGRVKTDWARAPFVVSYRKFQADACSLSAARTSCPATRSNWWDRALDANGAQKLSWVRDKYMIYDYCRDTKRFPQGFPPECAN